MKAFIPALILGILAAVLGVALMGQRYRLNAVSYASDQAVLDHRISAYSDVTWVVSQSQNYFQLRFFDKVEGGVCLRPSWTDFAGLAAQNPRLRHLAPPANWRDMERPGGPLWTRAAVPDPGTLSNTRYVMLYPLGVLFNDRLMSAAKGDLQKTKPRILMVGLGSATGIAVLAHHFPDASITVVDIDHVVINMVLDHFPLIRWLTTATTSDGRPRLRLVTRDARQYLRFEGVREAHVHPYDLVILDAYTLGSTIPPHLMTREFFAQCAAVMAPDGVLLANIIGSYSGRKRLVLGGAIRSMRAAGLVHAYNFPIVFPDELPSQVSLEYERNNIVLASRSPLSPEGPAAAPAAWRRIGAFVPYPELAIDTYVSRYAYLGQDGTWPATRIPYTHSALIPWSLFKDVAPDLERTMKSVPIPAMLRDASIRISSAPDAIRMAAGVVHDRIAVAQHRDMPAGWDDTSSATCLVLANEDWVLNARDTYLESITVARDSTLHSGTALVGPLEGPARQAMVQSAMGPNWTIVNAPLFTDARPNADIYNH